MPRGSDGVYVLPDGTVARPNQHNAFAQDIAVELNDSLSRSGKGGMSADLDMGGFDISALGNLAFNVGGVINWGSGDVTITHSANTLMFAGASSGYAFDVTPNVGGTSLVKSDDTKLAEQADAIWEAGTGTTPSIVAPDAIAAAIAALASGNSYTLALQTHTETETHTPTPGTVFSLVFCTGGGGGAGSGTGGGGGEAGGTAIQLYDATEMGASAAVTIGAAGAQSADGGNSAFTPAGTGGALAANGGDEGDDGVSDNEAAGGEGEGTATGGILNIPGGEGGYGMDSGSITAGGSGGSSLWGNAPAYGGGGRGGNSAGNAGGPGVVFIIELVET